MSSSTEQSPEKSTVGANHGDEFQSLVSAFDIEHLAKGHKLGRIIISETDQKTLESLYVVLQSRPLNQEEHDAFMLVENKYDEFLYGTIMRRTYGPGFRFED